MTGKLQRIALLGSTGSIGTQALDVIARFPGVFSVEALVAGNNIDLLIQQAKKFKPSIVVTGNPEMSGKLKDGLKNTGIEVLAGMDAASQVVASDRVDTVLASIVGYSGLKSVVAAVQAGKKIALANKETMVVAGEIINRLADESGSLIIPVDSEHSAIFQCLAGESHENIEKITLTASGGPFLNWTGEKLKTARPEDALRHPNWDMGCKVTIDSASMMNKGLEVIEARWLFRIESSKISVIVHPQSVIHSLVHFTDGSVKAQLGVPDMRLPILYALSFPGRLKSDLPRLRLEDHRTVTFSEPDLERFPCLRLAYSALESGGNMPCIMNAANEIAVNAFLAEKIGFTQIPEVVEHAMEHCCFEKTPDLGSLGSADCTSRATAEKYIIKLQKKT